MVAVGTAATSVAVISVVTMRIKTLIVKDLPGRAPAQRAICRGITTVDMKYQHSQRPAGGQEEFTVFLYDYSSNWYKIISDQHQTRS